jgi:hypothetical protein
MSAISEAIDRLDKPYQRAMFTLMKEPPGSGAFRFAASDLRKRAIKSAAL